MRTLSLNSSCTMGTNVSLPLPPVKPGFSTMCISFQKVDRVNVLHLDNEGLSVIRQAINETWPAGISKESSNCDSSWSCKLSAKPFSPGKTKGVSLQVRQMMCRMLQNLCGIG